jgi:hypothetical protein
MVINRNIYLVISSCRGVYKMKRSIWYEVCHNGNLERFWNINRTRNKIKVYIKNRYHVFCYRVIKMIGKINRVRIFNNSNIYVN